VNRFTLPIAWMVATGSWALARWVVRDATGPGDLVVYRHTARMMSGGFLPYRDFDLEYPPAAAALFWSLDLIPGADAIAWHTAMLVCLLVTVTIATLIARGLGLSPSRQAGAAIVVALIPLLLGGLVATRYDLAVSALLGGCVLAAMSDRMGWAWTLLAIAAALKLTPLLLAPALVLWHANRRGRPAASGGLVAFATGVAATMAPFLVLAPTGFGRFLSYHLDRPAQVESIVASVIHLADRPFVSEFSFGSDNLVGDAADRVALAATGLVAVAVIAIAVSCRRALTAGGGAEILLMACAATLAATTAFAKVASPQYLVWLLPVVLVIPGIRGVIAAVSTVLALALTHAVYPGLYRGLVDDAGALPVGLLVARNALLLVVMLACWPIRLGRREAPVAGSGAGHEPGPRSRPHRPDAAAAANGFIRFLPPRFL
jgi:uncharacterized membrane protein